VSRETCPRCRRPRAACLCPAAPPLETRTGFVLLTHPKEHRKQKTGTGRLARLNLASAEILPGIAFDAHPRVRAILDDPGVLAVLLYPGKGAMDLGSPGPDGAEAAARLGSLLGGRRLVVFLVDSTWACSHAVLRASPGLLALPRLMFRSSAPSRWVIKRQPRDYYLSTIEAIHELLLALEAAGLEDYPDKARLLEAFAAMQAVQVEAARAARRPRYLGRPSLGELDDLISKNI
jgi:DTW domain-containing protein